MKPFRGKRRGPQSPSVGFSPPAVGPACRRIPWWSAVRRGRSAVGALSAGGAPRPVCGRSESLVGKVAGPLRGRCYRPGERRPVGGPRRTRPGVSASGRGRFRASFCARAFDRRGLFSVPYDRVRAALWSGQPGVGLGSVANRSVTCPTRLETRTKESNMCASHRAVRNPEAQ